MAGGCRRPDESNTRNGSPLRALPASRPRSGIRGRTESESLSPFAAFCRDLPTRRLPLTHTGLYALAFYAIPSMTSHNPEIVGSNPTTDMNRDNDVGVLRAGLRCAARCKVNPDSIRFEGNRGSPVQQHLADIQRFQQRLYYQYDDYHDVKAQGALARTAEGSEAASLPHHTGHKDS